MECPICKNTMVIANVKFICDKCKIHAYFINDTLIIRRYRVMIQHDLKCRIEGKYYDDVTGTKRPDIPNHAR